MLVFCNLIAFIVSILFIWFKTNAFVEYCILFNVNKQTITNYKLTNTLSFPQFLYVTYKDSTKSNLTLFLLKVITCPICLCMWLTFISCIIFGYFLTIPFIFIISLFVYFQLCKFVD